MQKDSCSSIAKLYECSKCSEKFDRASRLDCHIRRVHLREKSQICGVCGKGFFRKNDLLTHLNIHLGTNQSVCRICGRKFNHVSNLKRHHRTHIGSKPYPCIICAKRFTQISSLERHKSIHSRESTDSPKTEKNREEIPNDLKRSVSLELKKSRRQYYCRVCGETFPFMILLQHHKKLHTKILDNRCIKVFSTTEGCRGDAVEKKTNFNDDSTNSLQQDQDPIGQFIELARKINPRAIDNDRDLSISDILSPYNCNEIELNSNLEKKLYENSSNKEISHKDYDIVHCLNADFVSSAVSQSLNSAIGREQSETILESIVEESKFEKSIHLEKARLGDPVRIEDPQLYVNNDETKYPETSRSRGPEVEDIPNFDESLQACFDEKSANNEKDSRIGGKSSDKVESTDFMGDAAYRNENDCRVPTLRLVDTETGQQFYELIVNNRSNDFDNQNIERNSQEFISQLFLGTNNDKGSSIIEDNREGLEKQNYEKSLTEMNWRDFLPNSDNHENFVDNDNTDMPMVRLVQNEDGEQFFELVRESAEYEKNRSLEKNNASNSSNFHNLNVAVSTLIAKKEKKDIWMENGQKIAKDRTPKFQCNECDKWFSTAYNFKQHAGTHFFDQQKYHCEYCGLSFAWKSTLNKHLASNHRPDGPQKFVCEICPKVYSTLSQVNEHVKRDHLKERNHVCNLCGKSFFKKFDLKTHSRIHTNERPYMCRACGKSFHHQSHIIRHERIHSGERPYECNICQRTFAQPGSLKSHRQRHRDVRIDILEYRMDEDDPLTLAVH